MTNDGSEASALLRMTSLREETSSMAVSVPVTVSKGRIQLSSVGRWEVFWS